MLHLLKADQAPPPVSWYAAASLATTVTAAFLGAELQIIAELLPLLVRALVDGQPTYPGFLLARGSCHGPPNARVAERRGQFLRPSDQCHNLHEQQYDLDIFGS